MIDWINYMINFAQYTIELQLYAKRIFVYLVAKERLLINCKSLLKN